MDISIYALETITSKNRNLPPTLATINEDGDFVTLIQNHVYKLDDDELIGFEPVLVFDIDAIVKADPRGTFVSIYRQTSESARQPWDPTLSPEHNLFNTPAIYFANQGQPTNRGMVNA